MEEKIAYSGLEPHFLMDIAKFKIADHIKNIYLEWVHSDYQQFCDELQIFGIRPTELFLEQAFNIINIEIFEQVKNVRFTLLKSKTFKYVLQSIEALKNNEKNETENHLSEFLFKIVNYC